MNISANFTLDELTKSNTAKRHGIDNTPGEKEVENLITLVKSILQKIRDRYGKPVIVSSGYRCDALNKLVGGSKNSQHKFGEAADIHSVSDTAADNRELFNLIVDMIEKKEIVVGQLIDEYDYNWIHVSLPTAKLNNQILHL